jgi:hypothetical protein
VTRRVVMLAVLVVGERGRGIVEGEREGKEDDDGRTTWSGRSGRRLMIEC